MVDRWSRWGVITFAVGMVGDFAWHQVFGIEVAIDALLSPTHLVLFVAAFAIVSHLRDRLPREDTVARVIVALLTNLALFLIFSFTQIGGSPSPAAAWPRLIADLVCSQIALALIAPWFFALQHRALLFARAERETHHRPE